MSYSDIPEELRVLPQWILWRLEDIGARKPTKVPYQINGRLASVTEPESWTTFDKVCSATGYSGIGFVFTEANNLTFIDLDDTEGDQIALDRQIKIFKEFDSYSEISPSGRGLHIIVKGKVPNGRRRSFIEVYSSQRYATFTGNIHLNKPIADRQTLLLQLFEQMGSGGVATHIYNGDAQERYKDEEIIEQAGSATNGEKFDCLHRGRWQDLYPSPSEADFAYIDIVSFYTQNRNQIKRIFLASSLGQRDKVKRVDYIESMINKSFDRMLPPIDFDGFKNAVEDKVAQLALPLIESEVMPLEPSNRAYDTSPLSAQSLAGGAIPNPTIILPPGLVGEIAQFIYAAAPRPVPEIALAAALGLMAGICGRAYNVSGTGLNQYILILAKTGRGKESAASGIDKLMNSIKFQVPTSTRFRGPGIINSGSALVKYINKKSNCFVSVLGEFGMTIEKISNPNASPSDKMLYANLLDLYNKSGHTQTFQPSIYSKQEDNIDITDSPALTILGESTPKLFYDVLSEEMISAGLLPRFLIIEYDGKRSRSNKNHYNVFPPNYLVDKFASLVAQVEQIMHAKKVINVNMSNEASLILDSFDQLSDDKINSEQNDFIAELWNRGHMKALRLSALIAVGVNMSDPIILPEHAQWAINLINHDIKALSNKFEEGSIGVNSYEIKQLSETVRMAKDYILRDWEYVRKYSIGKNVKVLFDNKIIPLAYLSKRLCAVACFRLDKSGSTFALKRAVQSLIDNDKIREVAKIELSGKYGTAQRAFVVSDMSILD